MFYRTPRNKTIPLNIVGSSRFGRYPKIDVEHTYNMFQTDDFMVPYPGYKIGIISSVFGFANSGRGAYSSDKSGNIVLVFDNRVYLLTLIYNQASEQITSYVPVQIGTLQTSTGKVYISENNKPQILISDGTALYVYDPTLSLTSATFTVTFLNSDFTTTHSTSNTILNLSTGTNFTLAEGVQLSTSGGGTLPTGLSTATTYYVITSLDNTKIELASTAANAQANIPLTFSADGTPTEIVTAVDSTILNITTTRPLQLGEAVMVSNSGGSLPMPLLPNVTYYVVPGTLPNTIQLALTSADATNGTVITFTTTGSGTNTLTSAGPFQMPSLDFTPGYITFHDTYFICAARNDMYYSPTANNTWRLSGQNDGTIWPDTLNGVSYIGTLETKPDNTQAVVRFPSRGNMIFVMGNDVTEPWYDSGAKLFPYQRSISMNIDYGCVSPKSVAYLDELVVWLAKNERSGPIIMASTGDYPEKITTDGIDFQFSQLQTPEDCEGFLYRQDGHIIYHLNFYSDNQSYFYDFNTKKIYQASDQNGNYFAMSQVIFYRNQYFAISKDDGNFYIFDTTIYTYQNTGSSGETTTYEIPRYRICKNIRLPSQDYFVATDIGFTMESGTTNPQLPPNDTYPKVELSISYNGGMSFGSTWAYQLPALGIYKNKVQWWQCGMTNDMVCRFDLWGFDRFVIADGEVNIKV